MNEEEQLQDHLRRQIIETQEHFCTVMAERLKSVGTRELELYFGALAKLVDKLEDHDKSLKQVAQETFAELAGVVMAELSR